MDLEPVGTSLEILVDKTGWCLLSNKPTKDVHYSNLFALKVLCQVTGTAVSQHKQIPAFYTAENIT